MSWGAVLGAPMLVGQLAACYLDWRYFFSKRNCASKETQWTIRWRNSKRIAPSVRSLSLFGRSSACSRIYIIYIAQSGSNSGSVLVGWLIYILVGWLASGIAGWVGGWDGGQVVLANGKQLSHSLFAPHVVVNITPPQQNSRSQPIFIYVRKHFLDFYTYINIPHHIYIYIHGTRLGQGPSFPQENQNNSHPMFAHAIREGK